MLERSVRAAALALAVAAGLIGPAGAQQEIPVKIAVGSHTLAGTLVLPAGEGPFPAAVFISGSGPSDRDESLPGVGLRPFALLADELQAAGIATLRYDDRGVAGSTGDFSSATAFDFAVDAQAAAAFLAARPEIDADRVGLIGHSEGGMVAPIVAARDDTIAFVISLAGTAAPGYDILARQLRDSLAALPADQRDAIYAAKIASLDLVVAEDWSALEDLLGSEHAAMPPDQRASVGTVTEYVAEGMIFYRGWLHTFATHDPATDWKEVDLDLPVLALLGGRDVQVRADLDLPALEAALADHANAEIVVLPTANHLFQDAMTGALTEYATLPPTFVTGFADTIANWIKATR